MYIKVVPKYRDLKFEIGSDILALKFSNNSQKKGYRPTIRFQ